MDVSPKPLFAGVVEGFYGRPWTLDQRRSLFTELSTRGLSGYLYAPKDDRKHRAFWRATYTATELGMCVLVAYEPS